jgi:formylglycine-generating enzyme required for sulfatase activity
MLRTVISALVALILVFSIVACAKKEEPAAAPETDTAAAPPRPVAGEMALIPGGEFVLGTTEKDSTAYPQQKMSLPAFWIDKYEVTNKQFLDFAIEKSYSGEGAKEGKDWRSFFTPDKALHPVLYITWNDAKAYCEGQGKRLPTEFEWEKAARGAEGFRYPWGNNWETGKSNTYETGTRQTTEIGSSGDVSPYGVQDMLGNVQEWTGSWYQGYKGNPKKDENYGQRFRVVRGASRMIYGARAHLWDRSAYLPNSLYDFGCRCAKDATPDEAAKAGQAK